MRIILILLCLIFSSTTASADVPRINIQDIIKITHEAGDILLQYYGQDIGTDYKSDNSPVTKADIASNAHITTQLKALTPHIPVISEETAHTEKIDDIFWILDPMDGTKSFINQTGQFTVNIALIQNKKPILGVVHIPLSKITYFNDWDGKAYKTENTQTKEIQTRKTANKDLTLVASRLHRSPADEAFIKAHNIINFKTMSSSIKFCLVAEGEADIYPRFGTTMEWDSAAGHAILLAAGGNIIEKDNKKALLYHKKDFRNPHFIAYGRIENYP